MQEDYLYEELAMGVEEILITDVYGNKPAMSATISSDPEDELEGSSIDEDEGDVLESMRTELAMASGAHAEWKPPWEGSAAEDDELTIAEILTCRKQGFLNQHRRGCKTRKKRPGRKGDAANVATQVRDDISDILNWKGRIEEHVLTEKMDCAFKAMEKKFQKRRGNKRSLHQDWKTKEVLKVNINAGCRRTFVPFEYNDTHFHGACGDTGSQGTVIGVKQAKDYCESAIQRYVIQRSNTRYKFRDGCRNSFGVMERRSPLLIGCYIPIINDVVEADIQFSPGLDFLLRERFLPKYKTNKLENWDYDWHLPLTDKFGHVFVEWRKLSSVIYTKAEL